MNRDVFYCYPKQWDFNLSLIALCFVDIRAVHTLLRRQFHVTEQQLQNRLPLQ